MTSYEVQTNLYPSIPIYCSFPFIPLSLSLYPYLFIPIPLSKSLYPYPFITIPFSLSLYPYIYVPIPISVSLYHYPFFTFPLSQCLYPCPFIPNALSLCIPFPYPNSNISLISFYSYTNICHIMCNYCANMQFSSK